MKILYFTDIHGSIRKYAELEKIAEKEKVDMVINGADILPNVSAKKKQHFIDTFFINHLKWFSSRGIPYVFTYGNDDYISTELYLNELIKDLPFIHNVSMAKKEINGFEFIGFNLVPDYPFRLKDRCRMDDDQFALPAQYGSALFTVKPNESTAKKNDSDTYTIEDWPKYAYTLPTIEAELNNLVQPNDYRKAIYLIHTPPYGTSLGSLGMDDVGSRAVMRFIMNKQPLLTLHGHIHEARHINGVWVKKMDKTTAIQPGQGRENVLTYVLIDFIEENLEWRMESAHHEIEIVA